MPKRTLDEKARLVRQALKLASDSSGPAPMYEDILELLDDRDSLIARNKTLEWLVEDNNDTAIKEALDLDDDDGFLDSTWVPSYAPPKVK